uniref:Uncharacterized protein n=1 Tax=Kalanchoe fedtschenkoi TaxID=63787 RepID=A0A7N0UJ37_KALFE
MEQGSAGDDSDPQKRKKRFHRHSAHQIQRLEAVFKECPHLDEKQRLQLSRELGLAPRQIKFWFQNRRTQMKGQLERADNSILKAENDKIRCSNIALREALKNIMCPNCGSMRIGDDPYLDEQQLHLENAHLKEELDRVSSIAAKYIGRPVSQFSTTQSSHISLIELSLGSFGGQIIPSPSLGGFGSHGITGSSLELDILSGTSSSVPPTMEIQPGSTINDMDKTLMAEIAANAMNDLVKLLQATEPLWTKSATDGRDTLNYENYLMLSPRAMKKPNARTEASRDSGVVAMNSLLLVDMFMDAGKWLETFSPIVSAAKTIQVLTAGVSGSLSGTLRLMYEELQVLSPLVPTREFVFLRYCQQTEKGSWVIVDVSCDFANGNRHVLPQSRRLPSGCLIEDMSNGISKVSWVEHVEIQDDSQADHLYGDLIKSGYAFGAERWLATLQRMCERYASLTVSGTNIHDLDGVIPTFDGKANMMKLSQRMVSNFCATVSTSTNSQQCTTLAGSNESQVRLTVRKTATDPGQPNGLVLCAATSIWLPVSPQNAFNFLRDWDVLSKGGAVQEVAHISCGSHPGNYISILRASDPSQNNMVILQECCIDSWGSLIVYSPVEIPEINMAVSGGDPSCIPLLPSGFMISPDGRSEIAHLSEASSTSSSRHSSMTKSSGSLITIGFQILAGSSPVAKLDMESVTTVNNLIGMTIHQIKAALDCPDS